LELLHVWTALRFPTHGTAAASAFATPGTPATEACVRHAALARTNPIMAVLCVWVVQKMLSLQLGALPLPRVSASLGILGRMEAHAHPVLRTLTLQLAALRSPPVLATPGHTEFKIIFHVYHVKAGNMQAFLD